MASVAQQLGGGLRCPPISTTCLWSNQKTTQKKPNWNLVVRAVASPSVGKSKAETKGRQMFQEAYEKCRKSPLEGVDPEVGGMTADAEDLFGKEIPVKVVEVDEEESSLVLSNRKAMADSQAQLGIGSVVVGTVQSLKPYGAFIDIGGMNGLLHVSQISHNRVADVATVLQPGDTLKVMILGHDRDRGRVSLSTKKLEPTPGDMVCNPERVFEKAEEMAQKFRQRRAQAAMARAVMLRFQPETADAEDLSGKEIPVKVVEVDEEESRLVLSNCKAMADSQAQLGIGSVVVGTVQSLKPYGAFIDIGGMNGLLHVSQISHNRVADVATVLQPGDTLKVMILGYDCDRGRVRLSTRKLEPTPGDMVCNPERVFKKAEEMAQKFRQRRAQAAMARADKLRFQPESGSGLNLSVELEGIMGSLVDDLPVDGPDLNDIPPAED